MYYYRGICDVMNMTVDVKMKKYEYVDCERRFDVDYHSLYYCWDLIHDDE